VNLLLQFHLLRGKVHQILFQGGQSFKIWRQGGNKLQVAGESEFKYLNFENNYSGGDTLNGTPTRTLVSKSMIIRLVFLKQLEE
jgi:hypothetical protein